MRRPFINNPEQLASLERQQYVVLRPTGAVADDYRAVQDAVVRTLPAGVKHPHTAHVTLRGFYEAGRLDEVRAFIRVWGASQHPIEITTEAIDTFPSPWQIVIARLAHGIRRRCVLDAHRCSRRHRLAPLGRAQPRRLDVPYVSRLRQDTRRRCVG